jgi:hypothetical protein
MTLQAPSHAPLRERSRSRRLAAPLLTAGVVGALTVALHYRDPHVQGSWGACPTKLLTGLDCPGCGGLRAVNDLTNLDLAGAVSSNLLFVLAVPLLVGVWFAWVRRSWRGEGRLLAVSHPQRWAVAALGVALVFAVVRNLPVGGWLAA